MAMLAHVLTTSAPQILCKSDAMARVRSFICHATQFLTARGAHAAIGNLWNSISEALQLSQLLDALATDSFDNDDLVKFRQTKVQLEKLIADSTDAGFANTAQNDVSATIQDVLTKAHD